MWRVGRPRWRRLIGASVVVLACAMPVQALEVPPFTGWVVDRAQLLPSSTVAQLTDQLRAHEEKTGNQVAVLTLPSLEGESVEDLAQRVFVAWGLGRKGTDNGVLLLVVPRERKVRIHVGYGLEGALTDVAASRIIRNDIVPRFRTGDFGGGVLAGVEAILKTIQGEYRAPEHPVGAIRPSDHLLQAVVAVMAGTIVGLLLSRLHRAAGPVVGSGISLMAAPWVVPAGIAAVVTFSLIMFLNAAMSPTAWGTRRRRSRSDDSLWYSTQGGGWGSGGFGGFSSDSGGFSGGGGGDSGGGGASGDW